MTSTDGRLDALKSAAGFGALDEPVLAGLAARLAPKSYASGATVFTEGDECRDLYVLVSGRVKFTRMALDGREQIQKIFQRPGDMFCLASAFTAGMHIVTGTAAASSKLLPIPMSEVRALAEQHPKLGMSLMRAAGEHLHHLVELADDLALKSATSRLAKCLHDAVSAIPQSGEAPTSLRRAQFREDELAAMLGTVRVNVSRSFAKLVRSGAIALRRDVILVHDRRALKRIAQGHPLPTKHL
jgi:CRP/FNR family transcriptional regulator